MLNYECACKRDRRPNKNSGRRDLLKKKFKNKEREYYQIILAHLGENLPPRTPLLLLLLPSLVPTAAYGDTGLGTEL